MKKSYGGYKLFVSYSMLFDQFEMGNISGE